PVVTYAAAGNYNVTLEATNSLGNNTETKSGYITILDPSQPPLAESFESILFLPQGWTTEDGDGVSTWELANGIGSDGNKSMKQKNFEANNAGSFDNLNTMPIDLSWAQDAMLTWDHAYRKFNGFNYDTLKVRVSTDCGNSWNIVWEEYGPFLATVGGFQATSEFEPTPAQWANDTASLDSFVGHSTVKVQFQCIGGNGQNIYVDNINLSFTPVNVKDITETNWSMNVSPNPFSDQLTINYELAKATTMRFLLTDITGKVLYQYETGKQAPGTYTVPMGSDIYAALPKGIYFLKGESEIGNITRKLVKMD
ncbi:MAG: T9SS type A sorting domain-containing protein, partial [Bacteroidota bacterium]